MTNQANERRSTEEDRWCEVCQQDDEVRDAETPLTVPTPAFPFRVCADCAEEWDAMVDADEWAAILAERGISP